MVVGNTKSMIQLTVSI